MADGKRPPIIPVQFINAFRPPSRHKTPPKAIGLDLPEAPHTPPETQKELEDATELSRTQQIQGLGFIDDRSKTKGEKEDELNSSDRSSSKFLMRAIESDTPGEGKAKASVPSDYRSNQAHEGPAVHNNQRMSQSPMTSNPFAHGRGKNAVSSTSMP